VAELERAQAQARDWQGRYDRVQAALQPPVVTPPTATPAGNVPAGFDPAAFAEDLLARAFSATALTTAAEKLRSEFPHADPSFYESDVLKDFGSVEALRAAVEADHARVEAIVSARLAAAGVTATPVEGAPSPLGPAGNGGVPVGGDPTPQQLAAMSPMELGKFMDSNPGVVERVLASPDNNRGLARTPLAGGI
jgi:hypothetical protein